MCFILLKSELFLKDSFLVQVVIASASGLCPAEHDRLEPCSERQFYQYNFDFELYDFAFIFCLLVAYSAQAMRRSEKGNKDIMFGHPFSHRSDSRLSANLGPGLYIYSFVWNFLFYLT